MLLYYDDAPGQWCVQAAQRRVEPVAHNSAGRVRGTACFYSFTQFYTDCMHQLLKIPCPSRESVKFKSQNTKNIGTQGIFLYSSRWVYPCILTRRRWE